jgi:hemoglobin
MAGIFENVPLWQTILLEEHTTRKPFLHINNYRLPEHFNRWMEIFTSTTDELFAGATAEEAINYAPRIAEMFNYKINYFRNAGQNGDLLNLK